LRVLIGSRHRIELVGVPPRPIRRSAQPGRRSCASFATFVPSVRKQQRCALVILGALIVLLVHLSKKPFTQETEPMTETVGIPFFTVERDPSRPGRVLITIGYNPAVGQQQKVSVPEPDLATLGETIAAYTTKFLNQPIKV
jgi:hypothetical protein